MSNITIIETEINILGISNKYLLIIVFCCSFGVCCIPLIFVFLRLLQLSINNYLQRYLTNYNNRIIVINELTNILVYKISNNNNNP